MYLDNVFVGCQFVNNHRDCVGDPHGVAVEQETMCRYRIVGRMVSLRLPQVRLSGKVDIVASASSASGSERELCLAFRTLPSS